MKAGEIVILAKKLMEVLSKADIKMSDWRYTGVYVDYEKAVERGEKVSAAVAGMAEKYGMSEASVWRVVRRMRKEVAAEGSERTNRTAHDPWRGDGGRRERSERG